MDSSGCCENVDEERRSLKHELCADGKMRRLTLPATIHERKSKHNAFIDFVRRLIGMELTRAGFPMTFFEPSNWLHRQTEQLESVDKLRHASGIESPVDRMAHVVGVFVSMFQMLVNSNRIMAHNPVLGETFEYSRSDLGFRIILEQVSHHPPVIGFYLESVDSKGEPDNVYRAYGNASVKATFWGTIVEALPRGFYTLELLQRGESYTLNPDHAKIIVSNLLHGIERFRHRLEGELYISRSFIMEDRNSTNGDEERLEAVLKYYPPLRGTTWLGGWDEAVDPPWSDGYIENARGEKLLSFYGKYNYEYYSVPTDVWESSGGWAGCVHLRDEHKKPRHEKPSKNVSARLDHSLISGMSPQGSSLFDFALPGQKLLWRKDPMSAVSLDYFRMSKFAMQLNELANISRLPPTDSRYRQDIRALENGDIDTAASEKRLIEEKQRSDLRKRLVAVAKKPGDPWSPLWFSFSRHPYATNRDGWFFTHKYYDRDWSECPDLGFKPSTQKKTNKDQNN